MLVFVPLVFSLSSIMGLDLPETIRVSYVNERRVSRIVEAGLEIESIIFLCRIKHLDRHRLLLLELARGGSRGSQPDSKPAIELCGTLREQCLSPLNLCPAEARDSLRIIRICLFMANRCCVLHRSYCHNATPWRQRLTTCSPTRHPS